MQIKRIVRIGAIVLAVCVVLGAATLGVTLWSIHRSVQKYCAVAQRAYPHPGDDVSALIEFMNSDTHPLRDRNLTIWTLGRLRNPKALPALEALYTGGECEHDKKHCQYELEKAIKLCGGIPQPPRKTGH